MASVLMFQGSKTKDDQDVLIKRKAFLAFLDASATPHTLYPDDGSIKIHIDNMKDMFDELSSALVDLEQQGVELSRGVKGKKIKVIAKVHS